MTTALITGASRGIGLELARQLNERGTAVIACCRRSTAELDALGIRVESGIDVRRLDSLRDLAQRIGGEDLGLLINNAGVLSSQNLGAIDEDAVEQMHLQYDTNALAPVLVTQTLMDNLREGSKVAIITSRMGSIADNTSGGSYGYRMSKAAVNMAGVSLAHDLKPRGIAVALLHPGFVRTEMTGRQGMIEAEEAAAGLIQRIDDLDLDHTGGFWHANGERLPW